MRSRIYRGLAGAMAALLLVAGFFLDDDVRAALGPTGSVAAGQAPGNEAVTSFPRDQVLQVHIAIAEEDLADLLVNAAQELDYHASITWNGRPFPHVSVRAKGNSSLRSVAQSDSNRYSLKVDLDAFVMGQSLNAITTINLNNGFSDPSYMREYLAYEAFASLGLPVPATTWVDLSVNGERWGLYLAVEQIGQPYLNRHFDNPLGDLYKADIGAPLTGSFDTPEAYNLYYKSNNRTSDHQALLEMIHVLNNGGDLEQHLDVDQVLRYLAASTVTANLDSYLGSTSHNYYLYEQDGLFQVLVWDLNMAYGGFSMGGGGGTEGKIDTPAQGTKPLVERLLAVDVYKERYHGYIQELIDGYLQPERFKARVQEVAALIDPYVKDDPTAFYTYEQFKASLTESVSGGGFGGFRVNQGQAPGAGARPGAMPGAQPGAGDRFGAQPGADRLLMGGGGTPGLIPFVQQRVANVQQQLDGEIPSTGQQSGMTGDFFGRGGMGGNQGQGQGGRFPGQALPGNFLQDLPEGFDPGQLPNLPDRQAFPGFPAGEAPPGGFNRGDRRGAQAPATTALGVAPDQIAPLTAGVCILFLSIGGVWFFRPRL